jgi:Leucine-rich repeat (LRR) protein
MMRREWSVIHCLWVLHVTVYAQSTPQPTTSGSVTFPMTRQTGARILHFPEDRSVGLLYLREGGANLKEWEGWQEKGQAQGDISVPQSKERRLDVSEKTCENLSYLAALREDDLHLLAISSPALSDADLRHLKGLTGLRSLTLNSGSSMHTCPMTGEGLAYLKDLQALRDLTILFTELNDENLAHLESLRGLENLSLLNNKQIRGEGLAHLRTLPALRSLSFYHVPVGDAGLENLKGMERLESLSLQYTDVTDAGLVHLRELPTLKSLVLPPAVTDAGLVNLQNLRSLEALWLSDTNISDTALASLGGLKSLHTLHLDNTGVSDAGLIHLRDMPFLQCLTLSGTNIRGGGLVPLKAAQSLRTLDLCVDSVSPEGLRALQEMTWLRKLTLGESSISDKDLAELKAALTDCTVNVRRVSGRPARREPVPASLRGQPLPDMRDLGIDLLQMNAGGKTVLVCFWDMNQRPSRHCLTQLVRQYERLREKNVVVTGVHVASPERPSIKEWLAAQNVPFAVGTVKSEPEQTRLQWGFRSLPWLILTDRQHLVVAEGITWEELARTIAADAGNPPNTEPARDATDPNAADLVREVRASEDWLHQIDSLQFRAEGMWSHPPESIAARRAELKRQDPNSESDPRHDFTLQPSATDSLEYAIDFVKQRLRYVENGPTGNHFLQIWDGQQLVSHIRHADGYEQYSLNLSREPLDRIFGSLSWPRAQPHSFWWAPEDVEKNMSFFGRPQDFRRAGQATYRGVSCYVLEFDPTHAPGQTFRWYVGCHDHLLYGRIEGFIENWTLDYQELAPKRRIPMTQGYAIREYDSQRKEYYIDVQREARIVGVRVNEALPESLFQMEWKEGIDVADRRSGETVWSKYVAIPPSLVGRPLPDLAALGIDPAREQIAGRNVLLCFCDMNQRPSRHGLTALAPQAEKLKRRGVVVLVFQAVGSEETAWAQPAGESELPWPVRTVKGDARRTRLTWGIRSLPWLILTDNRHIVTDEGFAVNELDDKLQGLENPK